MLNIYPQLEPVPFNMCEGRNKKCMRVEDKEIKVGFTGKRRGKEQPKNRWWGVGKDGGGIMGHTGVHELLENRTDNDEEPEDTHQQ